MTDALDRLTSALTDRYTIEWELGSGGMAIVYLAHDVKHNRKVAVKVLRPELAASIGADRFLHEIDVVARLTHPHILPLYDSGESDGFLYYVMPYVEGESLRDRLAREKRLPIDDALQITREVAAALSYANSLGVVHRDVKPENIMLSGGMAVLADFGIARAVGVAGGERLTETGMAVGTPMYMSPEQSAGDSEVDGRSDVYSLACVLYEMLGGDPPFTGSTPQSVLARKLSERAPSLVVVRDTVSAPLEAAVFKALARDAADRFATAESFVIAATRAVREGSSAATTSLSGPNAELATESGNVTVWFRRRWWLAAVPIVVLAVVFQVARRSDGTGLDARRAVVGLIENQTGDSAYEQVGSLATHSISEGLARTGVVGVVPPTTATQASRFVSAEIEAGRVVDPVATLATQTGAGLVISGSFFEQGSNLVFHLQVTDAIRDTLLLALEPVSGRGEVPDNVIDELRQRLMGGLSILFDDRLVVLSGEAMHAPTHEAYQEFSNGLTTFQRSECGIALPHFRRASELDSTFVKPLLYAIQCLREARQLPSLDSVLSVLAGLQERLTNYEREWLVYHRALLDGEPMAAYRAIARAAAMAPGSYAVYEFAVAATGNNRPAEAVRTFDELDPESGPMKGWFPYWLQKTWALHRLGDYDRELEAAREARRLYPNDMLPLQLEVSALAALHRVEEIEAVFEESEAMLARAERVSGAQEQADIWRRAGEELRAHGNREAGLAAFERALQWYDRLTPEEIVEVEGRLNWRGVVLYNAERPREAMAVFDTLLLERPESIGLHANLGVAAALAGDTARAEQALEWLDSHVPLYDTGRRENQQARVTARLGRREEAVRLLNEANRKSLNPRWWLHAAIDFAPLAGYPPFKELLRPKG
jgi:tetratricopeptide (TPR) repeat protein